MTLPTTPVAVAGSRRFWITVLCFALLNAAAWMAWHRAYGLRQRDLLRVESFSPGDEALVAPRETLQWRFNLDVGPGPGDASPDVAQVVPAIAGRWRWQDRRTLCFEPTEDLSRATRYTLTLQPHRLLTPEGFRLGKAFISRIFTPPLNVTGVRQIGFDETDRLVFELAFNDRVLPADVLSRLTATGPNDVKLTCELHGDAVGDTVRIRTSPVPAATSSDETVVTVRLAAGLAGLSGPLGLAEPHEDRIVVQRVLAATSAEPICPARGKPAIYVQFNGQMTIERLKQVLSVEPAVPFSIAYRWGYPGSPIMLTGDFQPATRYALKIAAPPAGAKRREYPRPNVLSVFIPQRKAGFWFDHAEGYLGSGGNRTVLAHAVNLPSVEVSVFRVYDDNLAAWRSYGQGEDVPRFGRPIARRTYPLRADKNKVQDLRISLDELLPSESLADGVYHLSLEAPDAPRDVDRPESASTVVTLSDIALTAKQSEKSIVVWTTSLRTARPLPGVRVRLYSDKNQLLGQAVSSADGLATISDVRTADEEHPAVILADLPPAPGPATLPASRPALADLGDAFSRSPLADLLPLTARPLQSPEPSSVATPNASPRGLTWLDLQQARWNLSGQDTSGAAYLRTGFEAFVYTERGVYRPGETVHLRAVVRGPDGTVPSPFPLKWQVRRPDLRNWQSQVTLLDPDGSAGWTLALPPDLVTGRWSIHVGLPSDRPDRAEFFGSATIQIEDYMPDRVKVQLRLPATQPAGGEAPTRIAVDDQDLAVAVQADYLFGRPAAGLKAKLSARLDPARFAPAQWSGWTFGDAAKLIELPGTSAVGEVQADAKKTRRVEDLEELQLDETGHGQWDLPLAKALGTEPEAAADAIEPGEKALAFRGPWTLSASASVIEMGGRAVSASDHIDVDLLPWYIAVRPAAEGAIRPGQAATFNIALVAPSGQRAEASPSIETSLYRESWNTSLVLRDGQYRYDSTRVIEPVPEARPNLKLSAGQGTVQLAVPSSGAYVLRLLDRRTGAMTSLHFYATDGNPWEDNVNRENPELLEVVILPEANGPQPATRPAGNPARPAFHVGQKASVLVRSPFPGRLLLTVETDRVLLSRVVDMTASQVALPLEFTESMRPNAFVSAMVIREVRPDLKWRTHRAYGISRLRVDPSDRRISLKTIAAGEIRPNSSVDVTIEATDARGASVAGAGITVALVDEGILQLTAFQTPDPLAAFFQPRALATSSSDIYSCLMPEVPRPEKVSSVGGDDDAGARRRSPIVSRRVKPVALFSGPLHTDSAGRVTARFHVPDFAGKLRIMAIAYAGARFGSADAHILVRSPVLVQSTFPRFAAPSDRFDVPAVIFNNSDRAGQVRIRAELVPSTDKTPLIAFGESRKPAIDLPPLDIPPGGQAVISIPILVQPACGVAQVRLSAAMGPDRCEEVVELPIRPASPMITRGGYVTARPNAPAALEIDNQFLPGTTQLQVSVTPWPDLQLPNGLDYLERYPYGCAEQTTSGCFPLVYLSDVGARIAPGVFEKQRVSEKLQVGILRLMGLQTADGGLGMWPGARTSWPWASVYAAHFLIEAEAAGHAVPEDFRARLLKYVRDLLDRSSDDGDLLEVQAYACYVLALAGKPERPAMSRLGELADERASNAPPDYAPARASARLYLAMAWLAAGRKDQALSMLPQSPPQPRTSRQHGGNLGSPIRDRALLVNTLLMVQPDHAALPSLVQQLADAGRDGQWRSTQDCAFSVMAMGRYLRQLKSEAPYETVELRRGDEALARAAEGKPLAWRSASAKSGPATQPATGRLLVHVTGPAAARANVTWQQIGVPLAPPPSADNGMKIRRRYLDADGKPIANDTVRSGDLLQVELTVEGTSGMENLVIEDLLPAGLEVENPRLQTSAANGEPRPNSDQGARSFSDDRLDVRDDRLILIGGLPSASTMKYTYLARAVTPGVYALPPVRAELMYDLGINSLSGAGRLVVLPMNAPAVAAP